MALNNQIDTAENLSKEEELRRRIKERQEADKQLTQEIFGNNQALAPVQQEVDPTYAQEFSTMFNPGTVEQQRNAVLMKGVTPAPQEVATEAPVVEEAAPAPQSKLAQATAVLRNGTPGPWRSEEIVDMTQRDSSQDPYSLVVAQAPNQYAEYENNNGIPQGYLERLAQIESGGRVDARNPNSSAAGVFQITDAYAKQYGVKDRMDPAQATEGVIRATKDAQRQFEAKYGRQPSASELYLMHQQGVQGAFNLIDNPNELATKVRNRDAIVNNGGDENMTSAEFLSQWNQRYEGLDPKQAQVGGEGPLTVTPPAPTDSFVKKEVGGEQEGQQALRDAGLDDPTINYLDSLKLKPGETQVVEASEMGLRFGNDFVYPDREVTDTGAMWQGILAGGLAMLGTALAGGDKNDIGAAFFLGGAHRFTNAMNQSHRYKNLQAMKDMGYEPAGIAEYIETGDRGALKQMQVGDWKELPDGSGRFTRQLPNGKVEVMQGQPKFQEVKQFDEATGVTVTRYWDSHTKSWKQDADGNPLESFSGVDKDWKAKQQASVRKPGDVVHVKTPDGKVHQAYSDGQGGYTDPFTQATLTFPQGSRFVEGNELKEIAKTTAAEQQAEVQKEQLNRSMAVVTAPFYNQDGSLRTKPPLTGNKFGDAFMNSNWAMPGLGGGRGAVPRGENFVTALGKNPEARQMFSNAIQLQGQVRNMAIQLAKANGASGINTVAEIRLFAESFPAVDFSSYENMVRSVDNLNKYMDVYMNRYKEKLALNKDELAKHQSVDLPPANLENESNEHVKLLADAYKNYNAPKPSQAEVNTLSSDENKTTYAKKYNF